MRLEAKARAAQREPRRAASAHFKHSDMMKESYETPRSRGRKREREERGKCRGRIEREREKARTNASRK